MSNCSLLRSVLPSTICLLFLFSFSNSFAQYPTKIQRFDERDGFTITDHISDVRIDQNKNVWIVSFSGLSRYNGSTFTDIDISTAPHASLVWFKETPKGAPYIVDLRGNIFFIEADTIRPYLYNHLIEEQNPTKLLQHSVFFDEQDRLHFTTTHNSYSVIENGKVSHPCMSIDSISESMSCIIKKNNSLIVQPGGEHTSLWSVNIADVEQKKIRLLKDSCVLIGSVMVNAATLELVCYYDYLSSNKFLMSSGTGQLIEFDTTGISKVYDYPYHIIGILEDRRKGVWISTRGDGLHYFPNSSIDTTKRVKLFENTTSIVSAEDHEGGLWAFSEELGLMYIPNPNLYNYTKSNSSIGDNQINTIGVINKEIWFGNKGRTINRLNHLTHSITDTTFPIHPSEMLYDIQYDSSLNAIWIAQRRALYQFKKQEEWKFSVDSYTDTLSDAYRIIPRIKPHSVFEKELLKVMIKGEYFYLNDRNIEYQSPIFDFRILSTLNLGDSVLVNTTNGLYLQVNEDISYLGDDVPLFSSALDEMLIFNNSIWVLSKTQGIFTFKDGILTPYRYKELVLKNARLVKKDDAQLWILSPIVNLQLSKGKNEKSTSLNIQAFRPLPKMSISQICQNDRTLFIGTKTKGVFAIDFQELQRDTLSAPPLSISLVRINREAQKIKHDSVYKLSFRQNFLQFGFHATSYRSEPINYRYRLVGLNNHWEYTSNQNLQYPNLNDGSYTFEVQVAIGSQPWSPSKKITFIIAPPFWETWWFILISLIIILFVTYRVLQYRITTANRENELIISHLNAKQEALQARMDPHFVFNVIASVQYLILNQENKKANVFLNMFSKAMRNILDQTNQHSLSIGKEVQFLTEYLNMERFRMEEKFNYHIDDSKIQEVAEDFIPPFLIQPFLENAIHHGFKNKTSKGLLIVTFSQDGPFLYVDIEDNGVGRRQANRFKEGKKHKSHGINIIKERLDLHNEKKNNLITKDLYDHNNSPIGTRVILTIKIMKNESINS